MPVMSRGERVRDFAEAHHANHLQRLVEHRQPPICFPSMVRTASSMFMSFTFIADSSLRGGVQTKN
jgi:hypothetical protein